MQYVGAEVSVKKIGKKLKKKRKKLKKCWKISEKFPLFWKRGNSLCLTRLSHHAYSSGGCRSGGCCSGGCCSGGIVLGHRRERQKKGHENSLFHHDVKFDKIFFFLCFVWSKLDSRLVLQIQCNWDLKEISARDLYICSALSRCKQSQSLTTISIRTTEPLVNFVFFDAFVNQKNEWKKNEMTVRWPHTYKRINNKK